MPTELGQVSKTKGELPKYRQILMELRRSIAKGEVKPGDRLPSEADLGEKFGVSRLTIQRTLKELQIEGLVLRRAGSGTYVQPRKESTGHLFGLLIPGLGETEIFEPMCQGMARAGRSGGHALLWGHTTHSPDEDKEFLAYELCDDYIARRVSGVFFAPLERVPHKDSVNCAIAQRLSDAGIAVVLLDRDVHPAPSRSPFDLVGIDNRRSGHRITRHLMEQGVARPVFLARPNSAPTVEQRYAGFTDAVRAKGLVPAEMVQCDPTDRELIQYIVKERRPDAFVCANDGTAANLMQTLETLGVSVPRDVRVTGFDDVRYAGLLGVPLTSVRQPCQELGETAVQTMLSRLAQPSLPARDVLLDCRLVIRRSCGSSA